MRTRKYKLTPFFNLFFRYDLNPNSLSSLQCGLTFRVLAEECRVLRWWQLREEEEDNFNQVFVVILCAESGTDSGFFLLMLYLETH